MASLYDLIILFLAAIGAGAVNALAGGGSIFTFPTLIAIGVPPLAANATNTIALCPGYVGGVIAQRRDLAGQGKRIAALMPLSAAGGVLGALLLTRTDEQAFEALVPALVLGASVLLALQERVRSMLLGEHGKIPFAVAGGLILVAAVYGGYFGAGLSVIFLAVLGLAVEDSLTRLNGLKQALALAANVAAAVLLAGLGDIVWSAALVMAVGALLGGIAGGRLASVVRPALLRKIVVASGFLLAAIFAWLYWIG